METMETEIKVDMLAKLEKQILDYYLANGYVVGSGSWGFGVIIISKYKNKGLLVKFYQLDDVGEWEENLAFSTGEKETTEELFTEAIKFFKEGMI